MPLNWTNTTAEAKTNGIKCLIYGPAGHGKTVLCASAPNPIFISAEDGLLSLNHGNLVKIFGEERAAIMGEMPVLKIRNGVDLRDAYNYLKEPKNRKQFGTICMDSISEIAEIMLEASKTSNADGRAAYGDVQNLITGYVRKFRALDNINFVATAKMGTMKDGASGKLVYGPDLPGQKLGPASNYWLDETFYLGVGVDEEAENEEDRRYRYLLTQPTDQYAAKDRSGVLDSIEPPDLTEIFAKITSGLAVA